MKHAGKTCGDLYDQSTILEVVISNYPQPKRWSGRYTTTWQERSKEHLDKHFTLARTIQAKKI